MVLVYVILVGFRRDEEVYWFIEEITPTG